MERKISAIDLKRGMYVSRLDRPWIETPFLFQGFEITSAEEIQQIQDLCEYVFIDIELGEPAERYLENAPGSAPGQTSPATSGAASGSKTPTSEPPSKTMTVYEDTVSVQEEVEVAKEIHQEMRSVVRTMLEGVRAGNKLNAAELQRTVDLMVESVLRNPNAFMWLMSLKSKDSYAYTHSVNTCILATAFGRHLGLSKQGLKVLATGALLFDVGKAKLPEELLNKPCELTDEEFDLARKHVPYGIELLKQTNGLAKEVISMVQCHHERYNGSGYPKGLKGKQIPISARIAAIVDSYDSMISNRPYKKAVSPHSAVNTIYHRKNADFDEALIKRFMEFIGVYPTGTLVELSTGEVGIVIAQDRVRRLQPTVLLVLDRNKEPYDFKPILDLLRDSENASGQKIQIVRALDPGSFDIDPSELNLSG
ncbi:MAG: HD-GYP domain-containing protein [Gammaproteobacteria bacterium]|nr:HD-GYP domain-containing protein [Gammaproteobacteria bacterium]